MTAGQGSTAAEINVTPLIDVLLVLLIIFMVITPLTPKGVEAIVPQPARRDNPPPEHSVVLQVVRGSGERADLRINHEAIAWEDLAARLREIYSARAERVIFIQGDDGLDFSDIAQAIDVAHAAGVDRVGLMTARIESGS